jgi:hypothetical protein
MCLYNSANSTVIRRFFAEGEEYTRGISKVAMNEWVRQSSHSDAISLINTLEQLFIHHCIPTLKCLPDHSNQTSLNIIVQCTVTHSRIRILLAVQQSSVDNPLTIFQDFEEFFRVESATQSVDCGVRRKLI